MKWTGGRFTSGTHPFKLLHMKKATFTDITFIQTSGIGGHVFDLLGSDHITIQNCLFVGYAKTTNQSVIRSGVNHSLYAESIQCDYASNDGGGANFAKYGKKYYNNAPTHHITVQKNQWLPYTDISGKLISYAQAPIGEHTSNYSQKKMISNITFKNNKIQDVIPMSTITGLEKTYFSAGVHFEAAKSLNITGNSFNVSKKSIRPKYHIIISNYYGQMLNSKSINIKNNKVTGFPPKNSFTKFIANGKKRKISGTVANNKVVKGKVMEKVAKKKAVVKVKLKNNHK
jgi:hypothetical protein